MFETTAIESRIQKRNKSRGWTLALAIMLHVIAISVIVIATVWTMKLPASPPDQPLLYIAELDIPLPLPPPAGPPDPPAEPISRNDEQQTATEPIVEVEVPVETPHEIPVILPSEVVETPGDGGDSETGKPGNDGTRGGGDEFGVDYDQVFQPGVFGVSRAAILSSVDPVYPRTAIMSRMEGYVIVQGIVGRDGRPRDIEVVRSSHVIFREPALNAIGQYRFKPGEINGRAVDTRFTLTVNFQLTR
ncbi:MAG: TonB family protein [Acidobacteria bacterium]|nr:TonB family protein [Acidobacteriota bacterium]